MAQTLKFGNGTWATKKGSTLAYNDQNNRYKPLPFTTTRDSIATRVNKQGLIEVVEGNRTRIDYTNSSKGALLLEPSSTNSITYSEDFSNAAWSPTPSLVTVTSNQFISPNGTQNADRLQIQSTVSLAILAQLVPHTINIDITISVWVKSNTNSVEKIKLFGDYGTSNAVSSEFLVTDYWKRIEFSFTPTATGDRNVGFYNVSGTSTDIQIYGFQAEANSSYATSYIPTQGSTVTRVADTASGAGNSEVFNDSEGVLFADISALADDGTNRAITISDKTSNNRIFITYYAESNGLFSQIISNGVTQATLTAKLPSIINSTKVLVKYKQNDFAFWVNGFEVSSDEIGVTPIGLNDFSFDRGTGTLNFYGKTKELGYYDTILTDSELEYLTSYRSLNELVTELNLKAL